MTALPNKCYSGHHKTTEEKCDKETLEKCDKGTLEKCDKGTLEKRSGETMWTAAFIYRWRKMEVQM